MKKKESINFELSEQKLILIMMKMLLTLDVKIFQKGNWMFAVSYIIKRKIKKIFLKVIFNTKILNINF